MAKSTRMTPEEYARFIAADPGPSVQLHVRIPPGLYKALKLAADEEGLKLQAIVQAMLIEGYHTRIFPTYVEEEPGRLVSSLDGNPGRARQKAGRP